MIGRIDKTTLEILIALLFLYCLIYEGDFCYGMLGQNNIYEGVSYMEDGRYANFQGGSNLIQLKNEFECLQEDSVCDVRIYDYSINWWSFGLCQEYPTMVFLQYALNDEQYAKLESDLKSRDYVAYELKNGRDREPFGDYFLYYRYDKKNAVALVFLNPEDHRVVTSYLQYQFIISRSEDDCYITPANIKERVSNVSDVQKCIDQVAELTWAWYPGEGLWSTRVQDEVAP